MWLFFGVILILVALIWISYKVYLSYTSAGGTNLMDPIYDAAVYPPMLSAAGAWCIARSYEAGWPFWYFILIWAGLAGIVVGALKGAQELGDKPL